VWNCSLIGPEAKKVFDEAQVMLDDIITNGLLSAHGIVGLFPANSVGDDIVIYKDADSRDVKGTMHGLRQQVRREVDLQWRGGAQLKRAVLL